jgi:hypothetical protein
MIISQEKNSERQSKGREHMKIQHRHHLWYIPLALAWIFDLLFWRKAPGISFPIFVLLCLCSGLYLVYREKKTPARSSLILIPIILIFAGMFAVRQEPMTAFVNVSYTLTGLAILAVTLLGGQWLQYSVSDYVARFFTLGLGMLANPLRYFFGKPEIQAESNPLPVQKSFNRQWIVPLLRGLLLALPVIALLTALLASADPIFSTRLEGFLAFFKLEKLGEYVLRAIYIVCLGFLLLGVFLYSLTASQEEKLIGLEKPWLTPFLGWIESTIILGSVDLLFAFFVTVQFQYFFGGNANIHIQGYTFAEYARRGFSELVAVAFISLLLFLGLSGIVKRTGQRQRNSFTGLGIGLVSLVIVILVSAFERLLLYEAAYGFSRIRTYTHVFMVWLGLLLVVTIVLEMIQHPRTFALAAVLITIGFGLTLNFINVDGFIARQNVSRALQGYDLDSAYLVSLSTDVTPTLANLFVSSGLPTKVKDQIGAALACRAAMNKDKSDYNLPWPSFHFSSYSASRALSGIKNQLAAYPVLYNEPDTITVKIGLSEQSCTTSKSIE